MEVREYAAAAYGAFITLVHEREQQAEDNYYREAIQEVIFFFFIYFIAMAENECTTYTSSCCPCICAFLAHLCCTCMDLYTCTCVHECTLDTD